MDIRNLSLKNFSHWILEEHEFFYSENCIVEVSSKPYDGFEETCEIIKNNEVISYGEGEIFHLRMINRKNPLFNFYLNLISKDISSY